MSTSKQQKKQTKREKKATKEAARAAALRAERRRNRITLVIVAVVVLIGGGIAGATVYQERAEQQRLEEEQEAEQERLEEEAAAQEEAIAAREPACGAQTPEAADAERETYEEPDDVLEEGVEYRAVIETSCGQLVLDLHADEAPETVNSFIFLAEEGFFDGLEIFRNATSIGALQTGGGNQTNSWQIGYRLPDELGLAEAEGYPVGSVAMANAGPNTGGSQFFFVYDELFDQAFVDNRAYAVFAEITEGMDVLEEAGGIAVEGETPQERVYMESVTIEES